MSVQPLLLVLAYSALLINPSQAAAGQKNNDDGSLRHAGELRFAIDDFNSVLSSEVNDMFGTRHLSSDESNDMWYNAIEYEWGQLNDQRRLGAAGETSLSPYLVCDVDYGKPGRDCYKIVEKHFGNLVTMYNDYDKSCYITSATPNVANTAPSGLVVTPLVPEAKLRKGIIDDIDFNEQMPSSFHALFCPGLAFNYDEAEELADYIIGDLLNKADTDRFLVETEGLQLHVSHAFLRSDSEGATMHEARQAFWTRKLSVGLESGACKDIYGILDIDVADLNVGFTVMLPPDDQGWAIRDCLHALVAGLSLSDAICSIEAQHEITTSNGAAQWVTQSNVKNSRPFFDVGLKGEGQVVQVSDTGIDLDNCYFNDASGNIDTDGLVDSSRRKVIQYVPWANNKDSTRGHGTHVAGSVAGKREGADGIADGMAPAAKIAFFDVGFSGSAGLSIPNSPSDLFGPGQDANAKIHSASWGTRDNAYGFGENAYDAFMELNDDFLFIVAAGNEGGRGGNSVGSPSICKNGISVGATQNAAPHQGDGQLGQEYLAAFSSLGPTADQRAKPDLLAPGMFIESAEARSDLVGECDDTTPNGIFLMAGTSMATPIVSGMAALIREYFENAWFPGGSRGAGEQINPSSALVKAVLMNGAQAITGIQYEDGSTQSSSEYDYAQRYGRINLVKSLPLVGENKINALVVDRIPIMNGEVFDYFVAINLADNCQEPLSAMLVWTDPPAQPGCEKCLINDLDLEIDGPKGIVYPNGLNSPDTVNNAERIRISGASDNDTFKISVRGSNLNSVSQNYALIVTGCFTEGDPPPVTPVAPTPPTSPPTRAPVVPTSPPSPFPIQPTMPTPGRPTVGGDPTAPTPMAPVGGRPSPAGPGPTVEPAPVGGRPTTAGPSPTVEPGSLAPVGGRPTTAGPGPTAAPIAPVGGRPTTAGPSPTVEPGSLAPVGGRPTTAGPGPTAAPIAPVGGRPTTAGPSPTTAPASLAPVGGRPTTATAGPSPTAAPIAPVGGRPTTAGPGPSAAPASPAPVGGRPTTAGPSPTAAPIAPVGGRPTTAGPGPTAAPASPAPVGGRPTTAGPSPTAAPASPAPVGGRPTTAGPGPTAAPGSLAPVGGRPTTAGPSPTAAPIAPVGGRPTTAGPSPTAAPIAPVGGRPTTAGPSPTTAPASPAPVGGRPNTAGPSPAASTAPVGGRPNTALQEGSCVDGNGTFFVDHSLGEMTCAWLSSNTASYPWLCTFRDVALECPNTCDSCVLAR